MTKKIECRTQWHIIVAYLWQQRGWLPTHKLQSIPTEFGFIGSSGEQRVRELARDDARIPDELRGKVEKRRGSEIGLDPKYEYFRFRPQLSPIQAAAERCIRFEAGMPSEQVLAV